MATMKYEGGYIPQNERQDTNARACFGFPRYTKADTIHDSESVHVQPLHIHTLIAPIVCAQCAHSLSPVPSYGLVRGGFSKSYPVVCVLYVQQSKKVRDRTWSKSPALLRYSYVPFFPLLVVRCLLCCCMCPWGSSTPRHRHHRCYRIHSYVHVLLPTGHGVLNRIASNS